MAYWNKKINLEVKIPYTTQICTTGILKANVEILSDAVWFGDDGRWKAYVTWGDNRLLVSGRYVMKGFTKDLPAIPIVQTTTYKVKVNGTHDGIRPNDETFRCRVVSWE